MQGVSDGVRDRAGEDLQSPEEGLAPRQSRQASHLLEVGIRFGTVNAQGAQSDEIVCTSPRASAAQSASWCVSARGGGEHTNFAPSGFVKILRSQEEVFWTGLGEHLETLAARTPPLEEALGLPVVDPTQAAVAMAIGRQRGLAASHPAYVSRFSSNLSRWRA